MLSQDHHTPHTTKSHLEEGGQRGRRNRLARRLPHAQRLGVDPVRDKDAAISLRLGVISYVLVGRAGQSDASVPAAEHIHLYTCRCPLTSLTAPLMSFHMLSPMAQTRRRLVASRLPMTRSMSSLACVDCHWIGLDCHGLCENRSKGIKSDPRPCIYIIQVQRRTGSARTRAGRASPRR